MARGLGRGIEAFFPMQAEEESVIEVKLNELRANPYQPRKTFTEEAIDELKQSIEIHGVLQPLIGRKVKKGYEIVAGERRFRAAKKAGLKTVPVIIKEFTDTQMMELALIENLQRENLNPIEEARAYRELMEKLDYTQEQLSKRIGKSRPHIANHVRLLNLPQSILQLIANGKLSMGHGRALLSLKEKNEMEHIVDRVIKENMNVRDLEKLVNDLNENVSRETFTRKVEKDTFVTDLENKLSVRFGTKVAIKRSKQKGKIEISFSSDEDFKRLITLLE